MKLSRELRYITTVFQRI